MPGPAVVIEPDELLYRQLKPRVNTQWIDGGGDPPVPPAFFKPSQADTDGLSLLRASVRHHRWAAFRVEQPDVRFRLAVVSAEVLKGLGCRIEQSDDALDRQHATHAHICVPELSHAAFAKGQGNRDRRSRALQLREDICTKGVRFAALGPFDDPQRSGCPLEPDAAYLMGLRRRYG